MDKGKGMLKDNVPDDCVNYVDNDYDNLFYDCTNPEVRLYAMGSDFEEDEEDIDCAANAMASMEGVVDALEGANMDALENSNVTDA